MKKVIVSAVLLGILMSFCSQSAFAYSGYDYTSNPTIGLYLDNVLNGNVHIFKDDGFYPVGAVVGNYPTTHSVIGTSVNGSGCYIYAQAVYCALFGETPLHGDGPYVNSNVVHNCGTSFSYSLFHNIGASCGTYVRTTPNDDGSYYGDGGHSFIVLSYDQNNITYLTTDSPNATIYVKTKSWQEINVNLNDKWWGDHISHIVYPKIENQQTRDHAILEDVFQARILHGDSNKVLCIDSGNNVTLRTQRGLAQEEWKFWKQSDGSYIITSLYNGRVLNVTGAGTVNNTNVDAFPLSSQENSAQKWDIYTLPGSLFFVPQCARALCLDLANNNTADGTNIQIFECNNSAAQHFGLYYFNDVVPNALSIDRSTVTMKPGETVYLNAVFSPENTSSSFKGVSWSTSNANVATVSSSGIVKAVGNGTAVITAISAHNDTLISSCTITVRNPTVAPTAISIDEDLMLPADQSSTLSVHYVPSDTTSDCKGVTWNSSNETVAVVNSMGKVTGVSEGTAVITATSNYNSGLKAICTVTVTKAIPIPEITIVNISGYNVHVEWASSELINENDIRSYNAVIDQNGLPLFSQSGTDTYCDANVGQPGIYQVTVTAYNNQTGQMSNAATRTFTVDFAITKDWQTSSSLPAGVTPETCEIEYKHTYWTTAQSSPGAEWTRGSVAREEWVNSGEPYISVTKLDTSDARQEILTGWYHFCGGEANGAGNFEQTGNFVHWDEFWDTNPPSRIREEYLGDDYGHPYYHIYVDGSSRPFYCQSGVTCDGSYGPHGERCKVWYRAYKYQDRTKNTYYYYTKTSDWTTVKDDSAYSVQYRFRLKDTGVPVVDSISVTDLTPNSFTLLCKATDDTGITKVVFASWTDAESETNPATQEITLESTTASAEASVTIAIADHNNVRDCYYNVKAYVYDGRGNVTEYECDSVYVPTLVHSARKLILPAGLIEIQDEAFEGSIGFGEVVIPDGAERIGNKAFSDCGRLTLIHIPDTVAEIASDAFLDSNNVVIFCDAGSYAAQYAHTNHIPYVTGE